MRAEEPAANSRYEQQPEESVVVSASPSVVTRIGLISDTHGFLDSQVADYFRGVEHILHAGDIGHRSVILALEEIAPVTAVIGNTDYDLSCRETEVVELGGWRFLLQHILDPHGPAEAVQQRLERESPDVVVFGHTHKPFAERIKSTWFINPGYAGKKRFDMRRSVAVLRCSGSALLPEFRYL